MADRLYWQQIEPRSPAVQELRATTGHCLVCWNTSLWMLYLPDGYYWDELNDGRDYKTSEAVVWASKCLADDGKK